MSTGTQIDLEWSVLEQGKGGEGAGTAAGDGSAGILPTAVAPSAAGPSGLGTGTYLSDEEILGMEPVSQAAVGTGFSLRSRPGGSQDGVSGVQDPAAAAHEETPAGLRADRTDRLKPVTTNDAEDLCAFREMFPGGAGEAHALRQAAQEVESLRASAAELQQAARAVEQIDAAIFSGDARAQGEVVAELARANPAAFRQLFAEAAKWYFGAKQEAGGSPPSPNGGYGGVAVARVFRPGDVSIDGQNTPASEEAGYSSAGDSIAGRTPPASHESRLTNHESRVASNSFDATAYASFERTTNDAVARDVRAAIGDTLARVLPDGVAEGAARRIGEDIFHEVHRTLAADRALSEQVASLLRSPAATGQGWRFGGGEQQRVASLLAGRARQLVPSVARRVVGEWTSLVLSAAGAKAARQAAAAARVDIGAPGGVPDSMPLRPVAARGVNYAAMSDDEILSM